MKRNIVLSLILFVAAGSRADERLLGGGNISDAAREALADEIAANVGAATENAARLREKALKIRVDAAKVRTGEWNEVWPSGKGMATNCVAGEIWNDAIQAAIDAYGAVYVPARERPYYLDAPIVLSNTSPCPRQHMPATSRAIMCRSWEEQAR